MADLSRVAEAAEIQGMLSRLRTLRDGYEGELRHAFNDAADRLDVLESKLHHGAGAGKRVFVVNGEAGGQEQ